MACPEDNIQDDEEHVSPNTIASSFPIPSVSPFSLSPASIMETCSIGNDNGSNVGQDIWEKGTTDMDDVDVNDDEDKDSSYIPEDKCEDDESDREMEDDNNSDGACSSKSANKKSAFKCSICSKSFSVKDYLQKHIRRVHPNKDAPAIKCQFCTKGFKDSGGLKQHILSTHEGLRYQCAHCPGTFSKLAHVRRHEQTVHLEGAAVPKQKCKVCGIHLLSKQSLLIHVGQLHKDVARMSCKEPVRITRKEAVTRKIIYQCQLCPTQFPERADLHSHQRRVYRIDTNRETEV